MYHNILTIEERKKAVDLWNDRKVSCDEFLDWMDDMKGKWQGEIDKYKDIDPIQPEMYGDRPGSKEEAERKVNDRMYWKIDELVKRVNLLSSRVLRGTHYDTFINSRPVEGTPLAHIGSN